MELTNQKKESHQNRHHRIIKIQTQDVKHKITAKTVKKNTQRIGFACPCFFYFFFTNEQNQCTHNEKKKLYCKNVFFNVYDSFAVVVPHHVDFYSPVALIQNNLVLMSLDHCLIQMVFRTHIHIPSLILVYTI